MRQRLSVVAYRAKALITAMTLIVSCGVLTSCGVEEGVSHVSVLRVTDGRYSAFGCLADNYSKTKPMTLISVKLIDPVGLELVEASTITTGIGATTVPPIPSDCDGETGFDCMGYWETRVPLAGAVIPPDDYRHILLVVRPTSNEPCLHARGAVLTYTYGLINRTDDEVCMGMVIRPSDDSVSCDEVFDK